jgi:hypothetical protein
MLNYKHVLFVRGNGNTTKRGGVAGVQETYPLTDVVFGYDDTTL